MGQIEIAGWKHTIRVFHTIQFSWNSQDRRSGRAVPNAQIFHTIQFSWNCPRCGYEAEDLLIWELPHYPVLLKPCYLSIHAHTGKATETSTLSSSPETEAWIYVANWVGISLFASTLSSSPETIGGIQGSHQAKGWSSLPHYPVLLKRIGGKNGVWQTVINNFHTIQFSWNIANEKGRIVSAIKKLPHYPVLLKQRKT